MKTLENFFKSLYILLLDNDDNDKDDDGDDYYFDDENYADDGGEVKLSWWIIHFINHLLRWLFHSRPRALQSHSP